jgi:hypothetical protein
VEGGNTHMVHTVRYGRHEVYITNRKIIAIEKVGVAELVTQDIKSVCQAMYRQRRKTQPNMPTSRMETIETLKDYEVKSSNGENIMFVSSSEI